MTQVLNTVGATFRKLLGLLLIAMVLLNVANAAGRYLFGSSIEGSDELLVFAMVWLVFLGAVLATARRGHLGFDVLERLLPPGPRRLGFRGASVHAAGALAMPVLVLAGIYLGWFSPTEAGGVACLYAMLLARWGYRSLTWGEILETASDAAYLTGQILIIVAAAALFSWCLTVQGVPQALIGWVQQAELSPVVFLLTINAILLLLGCLIDPTSAILVLTPILLPIVLHLGIDPIHFGVVMTVNLSIGMFTPPFGLNLFVAQSVLQADIWDVCRGVLGFFLVQVATLLVITYLPPLSLWLPALL